MDEWDTISLAISWGDKIKSTKFNIGDSKLWLRTLTKQYRAESTNHIIIPNQNKIDNIYLRKSCSSFYI
jgi:hypothetical protein